jgi:uncharacterized membrane protein
LLAISFAVLVPIIVAIGAYYGTVVTPLLLIGAITACIVLVAIGKIEGNLIYFYILGMSLGLLYQTTMLGMDVVGSDIHKELYYAKLNMVQSWNYNSSNTDNSSFVIWFIAPLLSRLLMLDMLWVFKIVLPIFLSMVSVVLFSVFKRQFGEMRAFFATIFFMIIPVFSMEIASIAKSMVAELFFALMVWVIVSNWKWQYKTVGICGTLIMQVICHYTVGVLGLGFLLGLFLVRLVFSPFKWSLFANRKVPLVIIFICLIIGTSAFLGYHGLTAGGSMVTHIKGIVVRYITQSIDTVQEITTTQPVIVESDTPPVSSSPFVAYMTPKTLLVNVATGLDFMDAPIEGKAFRIIQILTQLMIIIGAIKLAFFSKFNVTAEFVGSIGASGLLLLACIFVISLADTINMTRFYHFALFFVSPLFVIGCETVSNIMVRQGKVL